MRGNFPRPRTWCGVWPNFRGSVQALRAKVKSVIKGKTPSPHHVQDTVSVRFCCVTNYLKNLAMLNSKPLLAQHSTSWVGVFGIGLAQLLLLNPFRKQVSWWLDDLEWPHSLNKMGCKSEIMWPMIYFSGFLCSSFCTVDAVPKDQGEFLQE